MPVPYAGNPASFPLEVDILSGGDLPNTTNFNTTSEGTLDRTAYLNGARVATAGLNWHEPREINPSYAMSSASATHCGCWDPFNNQWLLGNHVQASGSDFALLAGTQNGQDWITVVSFSGNPTYRPIAMAVQVTSGTVAAVRSDLAAAHFTVTIVTSSGESEATVTGGMTLAQQGVMVYFYSAVNSALKQWMFVGSTAHMGTPGAEPWNGCALSGLADTTTWANLSADLPANWAPPPGSSSNSVFQWLAAIDESFPGAGDPNNIVFAQCGYRPGTDKSYLLQWNQANPTTFTDITPAFLTSGTYQVRGIAWSPSDQLWGMVLVDGDGNGHGANPANSYFLTSPDLVTWTTVHTFVGMMAVGLACNVNVWSIIVGTSTGTRVMFSNNVSLGLAQSWGFSDYMDHASVLGLASGYAGRVFLGNGDQFLTAVLIGGLATPAVGIAVVSHATLSGI